MEFKQIGKEVELDRINASHYSVDHSKGVKFNNSFLKFFVAVIFLSVITAVFTVPSVTEAADQENCMFCHQYPLLGTVDDNGTYSSFYVGENHYMGSVHAGLYCTECHLDITKVPHDRNQKISCTGTCHVTEPTIGRQFSHEIIDNIVKQSVHSVTSPYVNDKSVLSDFPTCVSCHINEENKVILRTRRNLEHLVLQQAQGRCFDCHSNLNSDIEKNLVHVLRRTENAKNQKEILDICATCHNDKALNQRHGLVNAVYSYLENYHGKTMMLGLETAPSCLDCHVRLGDSLHAIKSVDDPTSATYPANRGYTCTRADCHPNASLGLGKSYIHVIPTDRAKFPIEFWLMFFFTGLTVISFVGLMLILVMELFRMIFPKFSIFKSKDGSHHE